MIAGRSPSFASVRRLLYRRPGFSRRLAYLPCTAAISHGNEKLGGGGVRALRMWTLKDHANRIYQRVRVRWGEKVLTVP